MTKVTHKGVILFTLFTLLTSFSFSQKLYFDRSGKSSDELNAYYFREKSDAKNPSKAFYKKDNTLFFEGLIIQDNESDDNLCTYSGRCIWYFKDGKKKFEKNYNTEGKLDGLCTYYYETGNVWKEIQYVNGSIKDNFYIEYEENGEKSKIFEDNFENNDADWDTYTSEKTSAKIVNSKFELISISKEGASRYIALPISSDRFAVEITLEMIKQKAGSKAGLIFGFKDWENYNYFVIDESYIYIGAMYEGIASTTADAMFAGSILENKPNKLKLISNGEKIFYSINGEVQASEKNYKLFGNKFGFIVSGETTANFDNFLVKEIDFSGNRSIVTDANVKSSGSGIMISENGYMATNYHVVENAKAISVDLTQNGETKSFKAKVVQTDKDNDLAIIKIEDETFVAQPLKYNLKLGNPIDVGASVFTIGYPFSLSGMGKEAKFADGKISSKTGFENAINAFQTTIPVQPGNSGGPLFNEKGDLIGIMNAKFLGADNVSYAIKLNYLNNIIELLPESIQLPSDSKIANLSLEEKIKIITGYVGLIKIK